MDEYERAEFADLFDRVTKLEMILVEHVREHELGNTDQGVGHYFPELGLYKYVEKLWEDWRRFRRKEKKK